MLSKMIIGTAAEYSNWVKWRRAWQPIQRTILTCQAGGTPPPEYQGLYLKVLGEYSIPCYKSAQKLWDNYLRWKPKKDIVRTYISGDICSHYVRGRISPGIYVCTISFFGFQLWIHWNFFHFSLFKESLKGRGTSNPVELPHNNAFFC